MITIGIDRSILEKERKAKERKGKERKTKDRPPYRKNKKKDGILSFSSRTRTSVPAICVGY